MIVAKYVAKPKPNLCGFMFAFAKSTVLLLLLLLLLLLITNIDQSICITEKSYNHNVGFWYKAILVLLLKSPEGN